MTYNQEFTTEQKIEKAVWAATIFCKYKYRDWDVWVIEHISTNRILVESEAAKLRNFKLAALDERLAAYAGMEEKIFVQSGLGGIKFGWWEAWAIAEALERQNTLPGA